VIVWDVVRTRWILPIPAWGRPAILVDRITFTTLPDWPEAIRKAESMNTRESLADGTIYSVHSRDAEAES
jgi:hypothetical protein